MKNWDKQFFVRLYPARDTFMRTACKCKLKTDVHRNFRKMNVPILTLEVEEKFAHYFTVYPYDGHRLTHCHWHANDGHQQVSHRKVDDKIIRYTKKIINFYV